MTPVLRTPRLHLRALKETDLPVLVERINDWEIVRWLAVVPFPYTVTHAEEFFDIVAAGARDNKMHFFAITDPHDDTLLGGICLQDRHPDGEWDLGYWLARPFWGHGLMHEAIEAIIDFGFNTLQLEKIGCVVHLGNQRSRRAVEKAGFDYLGIIPAPPVANRLRGTPLVHAYLRKRP